MAQVRRKNYLWVGSQTGGRAAVTPYRLIKTSKLKGIDPQVWLAHTFAPTPDCKIDCVDDFLQ